MQLFPSYINNILLIIIRVYEQQEKLFKNNKLSGT